MTCKVCGKPLPKASRSGGRPRLFCSDRCKEKDKRRRARDADRASMASVRGFALDPVVDPLADMGSTETRLCHVCSQRTATVGTPQPLLCGLCASPV